MFKPTIKEVIILEAKTSYELQEKINDRVEMNDPVDRKKCKHVHTYVVFYNAQDTALVHEVWVAQLTY